MRGDLGAKTVLAKDIKSKLKYVQHIYSCENEILIRVLETAIDKKYPYIKKLLIYLNAIGLNQVSELREIGESVLS